MAPKTASSSSTAGISCNAAQLQAGQCSLDVYQTLGIRQDQPDTNVGTFVSDITLSATFFIGTVVAIGLMYSGWLYITAKDEAATKKGKDGMRFAFIGLLLVMGSYSIIRLVQYIAKG
jgi:hypothetical protein